MSGVSLSRALDQVAVGGLLAFPTETVWGLGADASSPDAVKALFAWKGRGPDKPLSVLVAGVEAARELGAQLGEAAGLLADHCWPGPLTLVVPFAGSLAPGVARADGALGLRCSPHPTARALAQGLRERGAGPLTATSLNRAGTPPARSRHEAEPYCEGEGAPILIAVGDADDAGGGPPSSVLDCTGPRPILLREGGVPAARIHELLETPSQR